MAGPPDALRCNGCGMDLNPMTQCVATMCHHLFCTGCAQKLIEADDPCPLCAHEMTKGNVKLVTILQPAAKIKLMMCGQSPEVIAEAALTGINCYVEQQRLSCMYVNHQLKNKMAKVKAHCQQKLAEMQAHYVQAREKYAQIMHQRNALEQDNQELQAKYAQKASQARKLQEMFKALQAENDELKRALGVRGGGAGASGAGRSGQGLAVRGGVGGGGSGPGRSSFGGASTQTQVTTVQHTKAMFDLSPASATGLHLLTGHGSAVAGSGNTMFGGPPRAVGGGGGGGQRPSTAGGMFGAAALANNNRGGGGGNGLRLQGGFSSPAGGFSNLTG